MNAKGCVFGLAVVVATTIPLLPAAHGTQRAPYCRASGCGKTKGDGAEVGMSKADTSGLPKKGPATVTKGKKTVKRLVPYEYQNVHACPHNAPDGEDAGCERTFKACINVKDADGPLVTVYRRLLVPNKRPGKWDRVGETCWPNLVPNASSKPELTVAMIRAAFIKTPFVKPKATMEPVGNRTLVNLPNYFTADFSGPGYGPDEVRTVTLLGHKVQIKPVLKSNTFHFGDGSSLGPTESRGGGYPDGDVKHTYEQRGTVKASVTTVYGGQFAVDGGKFTDLPGSATITGPAQPIQVLEATGRLVR
ncbi:hypothetical protein GCM10011492_11320 [Flexivirga endophytica]|uniref:PKD domain-containing protein n=1 Tax=Flexivirga endophytica TaxID=1849103 RepID=A0A916WRB5_9MICO|nr:hypothetical protein GCM10011492_11320 [Flexivirga endophytica]GHB57118.1 hypothetical protein GCM10008112_27860 [Flexivirga endophytica]